MAEGTSNEAQEYALQCRLVMDNRWLLCHAETTQPRLVDLLNANAERLLPVWVDASGTLDDDTAAVEAQKGSAACVNTATIFFGVPIEAEGTPAPAGIPAAWIEKSLRRVRIGLGPYEIAGIVHLPKESGRGAWALLALEAFFAVTDARIKRADGSRALERVVIVNRAHVQYIAAEPPGSVMARLAATSPRVARPQSRPLSVG
ncbi:MAG: hypothetical protein ACYC4L_18050 [Chloroflexota bacterium]